MVVIPFQPIFRRKRFIWRRNQGTVTTGRRSTLGRRFFVEERAVDIFKVGFLGHKEVEHFRQVEEQLRTVIRKLLDEEEFVEFYVGRNGEFDIMVASVIKSVQRDVGTHNSCHILVLPYPVADYDSYEEYYNEVIIPHELGNVHFKAAIERRNEWIIDNSDLLVMHVVREESNSAKYKRKAEKMGRKIINLT